MSNNKKKKYGKKPYLREDAVKNSIFLEEINKNPIKKKLPPQARFFDDMNTEDAAGKGV
tara:strand:- start:42 stop:218 length:177 start_codon:yes stop_codon:yes gene_type:complete